MPLRDHLVPAALLLAAASTAAAGDVSPKSATLKDHIAPLLAKYCGGCHGPGKPKAGLDVLKYDEAGIGRERKLWARVRDYVESGEMPPEDQPQPTEAEADLLVRWIDARIQGATCQGEPDPGRVTLRRLNRVEYNNTIRDLVGVDFKPAEDFPSDDVGYGFDNIGDVLTLPPLLMERYLAAAEQIAERAIVGDPKAPRVLRTFELRKSMPSTDKAEVEFKFPADGTYRLRGRAYGDQAGPEKAKMAFLVDGRPVKEVEVPAVEGDPGDYEIPVTLRRGKHTVGLAFTNDYYKPDDPNPGNRDRNLYVEGLTILAAATSTAALPDSHKKILYRMPKSGESHADVARELLGKFATRAYRRPARKEEIERLGQLVVLAEREGLTFEQGVQLAVQAVLVSPHFLFRVEVDRRAGPKGGATRDLNDFELASRLSYFLWSSMPDDELFKLALDGTLKKPEVLEAQARRMLKDSKATALVENFAGQWLQFRNLAQIQPDPQKFPGFDDALRAAMRRETELFFDEIARRDRSVLELIDADYTFLNERLAKHYGIAGVKGDHFRRVKLQGERRGGVLTHASVLTVTSNPTRTSPVKRGKWILEQILGTPPPPPPPDVPDLMEDEKAALSGSLRQRMEQHRSNPACANCHARLDPLGFGFENYDAIGAWRDKDGTFDVDASGTLPGGRSFRGPAELRALLVQEKKKEFVACLTEKLLTYALGRGLDDADQCVVEAIGVKLAKDGHKFSRLVAEIVKSDPFRKRNVGGDRR